MNNFHRQRFMARGVLPIGSGPRSRRFARAIFLCVAWTVGSSTTAGGPATPDKSIVDQRFEEAVEASRGIVKDIRTNHGNRISGMSVSVVKGNRIVWFEAFGLADVERQIDVTRKTRFRLASASKAVTGSLCAKLAERSKIDLDRDIRAYLPSFPDKGDKITLRLLLGHLGCIRHYQASDWSAEATGGSIDGRTYNSTEDALALFANDPLACVPGEKYKYSTFGFTLIGAVLESGLKKPFPEILRSELLAPLQLASIGPDRPEVGGSTSTKFYKDDGEIVEVAPGNSGYKVPGGGLFGTADDLARFGAAHFEEGFFSKRTLTEIFTVQRLKNDTLGRAGLAWRVGEDENGRPTVHHAGAMPGARSIIVVYRQERLAIAILTNVWAEPANIRGYAAKIATHFLGSAD